MCSMHFTATTKRLTILVLSFFSFVFIHVQLLTRHEHTQRIFMTGARFISSGSWCADCLKVITIYDATRHNLAKVLRSQFALSFDAAEKRKNFPMTMPLGWPPCASLPLHMLIHSRNHYPEIEVRPCRMCFFPCRRPFSIVDGRRTKESRMCDCLHLQMNYCPKVTVSLVSHICYYDFFALSFFLLSFFSQRPAGSCVVFFLFS